jgi:nicotinate dehydrogenase subunit A
MRQNRLQDKSSQAGVVMAADVEFVVNGESRQVAADPGDMLLLALRNELGLRGTRHGCATGHCGACTVVVDGRTVTSCNTPLEAVAGASVDTIEAFEGDATGRAVLAAFMHDQAGQCGYCLPGILIEAKALLGRNAQPTRNEIAVALDGHLCRCGAHHRILNAIERAAAELSKGVSA